MHSFKLYCQKRNWTIISMINAWAIDIVVIALGWQLIFAKSMSIDLTWKQPLILALSTWLVYMGDRWLDVERMAIERIMSKRRLIIKHFRNPIRYSFIVVLIIDLSIALLYLSSRQLLLGISILLGTILYVKFVSRARIFPIPKEIIVSILFALGTFLFLINEGNTNTQLWISLILLILILMTNASLIAFWEITLDIAENQFSLATRNQIGYYWVVALSALVGIIGFLYFCIVFPHNRSLALAFLASGLGLFSLHFLRQKLSPEMLHFLADVCLLSPWLFMVLLL